MTPGEVVTRMSVSGSASSSARCPVPRRRGRRSRPSCHGPAGETNASSPTPKAAAARARFVTTASGASPTWSPRLSVSTGAPTRRGAGSSRPPPRRRRRPWPGQERDRRRVGHGADHIEPGRRSRRAAAPPAALQASLSSHTVVGTTASRAPVPGVPAPPRAGVREAVELRESAPGSVSGWTGPATARDAEHGGEGLPGIEGAEEGARAIPGRSPLLEPQDRAAGDRDGHAP